MPGNIAESLAARRCRHGGGSLDISVPRDSYALDIHGPYRTQPNILVPYIMLVAEIFHMSSQ